MIENVVFLLEEKSAKAMIESLWPRIVSENAFILNKWCITFSGKQDLLKNIELKIKCWKTPNTLFYILCDKDNENCINLKKRILESCKKAGACNYLVRIACAELESFYLGDLLAVEKAFNLNNLNRHQEKKCFRDPDNNVEKPDLKLKNITNNLYSKVAGSREIGKYLNLKGQNKSQSFNFFINGLKNIIIHN